ncbi:MAG: PIN/TRAM domain-containing protein [Acidimicrobiia bacterium]
MIIEAVRLLVTLATTAVGFQIGRSVPDWFPDAGVDRDVSIVVGAVLGAGIGYVAGGLLGRLIGVGIDRAPELVGRASGPQLFAGAFGVLFGIIVGALIIIPLVMFLPSVVGWLVGALVTLILAAFGGRVFSARAPELLAVAGLRPREPLRSRRLEPATTGYLIDSSAAIDGRILALCRAGLMGGEVWLPEFVIDELQGIADSGNQNRRRRGRRGLDVLDALRDVPEVDFRIMTESVPEHEEVDAKLLAIADRSGAMLVTTDHNLSRAAQLRDIRVINPHALGESLRPSVVTGDRLELTVEREGSEAGQGIGFLDDGTMVVIEGGAGLIGETVNVEVANSLRTSVGRMLFANVSK